MKWLLLAAMLTFGASDHQHDFDFEFGAWKAQLRIRPRLSNSDDWTVLNGTSVVRKIWDGRANAGELEVGNATTHLEGLTMRFYNPKTQQWSIYWSNVKDGGINGAPMVGNFTNDRGEFYGTDVANGATVYARFIFSDMTPTSFKLEQAFSSDGGKRWETNWVATFTK